MAKSWKGLLDHCKAASSWKYVYGAKGTVLSRSQIQALQNTYGKNMVWDSDLNKAGNVCCDCSGFISSYTGIARSSSNYKATAKEVISIAELKAHWSKYVGYGLWLNGHIGLVSDTPGYYYAMDGSGRNWVHNPLSKNNWVCAIKLCDIDYSSSVSTTTSTTTASNNSASGINVTYRAYANGKWYSAVKNCDDYAGIENKAISGVAVKSDQGVVKYRVHVDGKWLPFVTSYNVNDANGYAGIKGKPIDGIQMEINGKPGYNIMYRVSVVGSTNYLPWVTNWNNTDNGYAGIFGRSIDKVQIKVVKK